MENDFIKVSKITIDKNRLNVDFIVSDNLKIYFNEFSFWAAYSEDISNTPESIAVIPFICNVLPLVWRTGSILSLDNIDMDFFNNINKIKEGFLAMFPKLQFNGNIFASKFENNKINDNSAKVACLFSGGVDAFATLLAHKNEFPDIITIWGADVRLDDNIGWSVVQRHVDSTSKELNIENSFEIKCNFNEFLNKDNCNKLVKPYRDNYWHGFQHGIGLLSLCSPIAYCKNIRKIYIASSFTMKERGKITIASDPSIDNNLHFCGVNIWHDQYDINRQQKIGLIIDYCRTNHVSIKLRTCYMEKASGGNCCQCEKCTRTIFGILAEDEDPTSYGYDIDFKKLKKLSHHIKYGIYWNTRNIKILWDEIKNRFKETGAHNNNRAINWIYSFNFFGKPGLRALLYHYFHAIKRRTLAILKTKK